MKTETLTSLDKSLSTLINGATEKGAALVDFLYAQAPEVINQMLLWHGIESFVFCIGGLFLIVVSPFIIAKVIWFYKNIFEKHIDKDWNEHPGFLIPSWVFGASMFLVSQINGWGLINLRWLKIWIAPKVYLLEYIAQMVK
jgi:hypothetical protein